MQTEERYDDLTALFKAQDDALKNDVFVDRVMRPIHKRSRWRGPLLFGAGGLGLGAAVSQVSGLFDLARARAATFEVSFQPTELNAWETISAQPLWIAAVAIVVVGCAAIVVTDRA